MAAPTHHTALDSAALLEQLAAGDEHAFKAIFDAYFDTVYSTALRYTVIRQHAEDATQQVFMGLWERRTSLPNIHHLESYLFTAAKREILQHFRKQSVRREYVQHVIEIFGDASHTLHPEALYIAEEQRERYQRLLDELPTRQREAFLLSREQGMTYAEVAIAMGISKDTVKEYVGLALKYLRSRLIDHPDLVVILPLLLLF